MFIPGYQSKQLLHLIITSMDKAFHPDRFNEETNIATAAKDLKHWIQTFEYYTKVLPQQGLDKLKILTNFVSLTVYDFISDCTTYESAKETLNKFM